MSKRQNRHTDVMHESRLTPIRQHFLAPIGFVEIRVVYARMILLVLGDVKDINLKLYMYYKTWSSLLMWLMS